MMNIEVNGRNLRVKLYENSSAEAVKELLKKGPLTINTAPTPKSRWRW